VNDRDEETKESRLKPLAHYAILRDRWFWLALAASGFVLSLTVWFGFGMDQSIYSYGAWVWKHYHLPPYIGVWDQNWPGIFIVHRIALEIFGETILGFRIFDFLIQLSAVVMIFYLAQRLLSSSAAGFFAGIFYSIYYYGLGFMGAGEREAYIFWILLVCTVLVLKLGEQSMFRAALIGLFSGFAFLLKPTFALAGLVFAVLFLAEGIKQKRGRLLAGLSLYSLFFILPLLAVVFYYQRLDRLSDLYRATIWYNLAVYRKMGPPFWSMRELISSQIHRIMLADQRVIFYSSLFGLFVVLSFRLAAREKKLFWLSMVWALTGIFSCVVQDRYFPYHLIPFWGFMTIYAGAGWGWLTERILGQGKKVFRKALAGIFLMAAIGLMIYGLKPYLREFAVTHYFRNLDEAYLAELGRYDGHLAANYYLAALHLRPIIMPDDGLEFFGPYPLINFVLKKKLPSRFPCVQSLILVPREGKLSDIQREWIREYSSDVIKARPRFFLVSNYFPGQKNPFFNSLSPSLEEALNNEFPDLRDFLRKNYTLKSVIRQVDIYERL